MIILLFDVVMIVRRLSHLVAGLHASCHAHLMYVSFPTTRVESVYYALLPNIYYTFLVLPIPRCTLSTYSSSSHNNSRLHMWCHFTLTAEGSLTSTFIFTVLWLLNCNIERSGEKIAAAPCGTLPFRKDPAVRHSLDAAKSSLEIVLRPSATPSVHVRDV